MNTVAHDPFLNDKEAADHLGCSPATLKVWRTKKIGPRTTRWNGLRSVRYRLSDLEAFIQASAESQPST